MCLAIDKLPVIPRPIVGTLQPHASRAKPAVSIQDWKNDGFRLSASGRRLIIEAKPAFRRMATAYVERLGSYSGSAVFRPSIAWRGVHLFVGPDALAFHKKLWTNVLLPLGYNKVVLQCEQSEWNCLPNLRGGNNMKRADLKRLCEWYRSVGVEVIPLVQSFGHVQWLAQGGKNLDLMMNPMLPYTVDPRKPAVAKLYAKLWDEVIAVTRPKTIHFGLDEIAFRGMPKDAKLVTKLWRLQVPMLAGIAKRNNLTMMLWGDEILAPSESALPANAGSVADAEARRAVLPRGAYVCDWHYQNNPDPAPYSRSLDLLKAEGFRPIASSWWRPGNVRGQCLAAIQTGAGTLQTTWAGYSLNEAVVRKQLRQFGPMVLAADYAWGWKGEVSYDAGAVFLGMLR